MKNKNDNLAIHIFTAVWLLTIAGIFITSSLKERSQTDELKKEIEESISEQFQKIFDIATNDELRLFKKTNN